MKHGPTGFRFIPGFIAEPWPCRSIDKVTLVRTRSLHGEGEALREVTQLWTEDGKYVGRFDPIAHKNNQFNWEGLV